MPLIGSSLGALAVAAIYYAYRDHLCSQLRRERTLRERVTYLLWVAAAQMH